MEGERERERERERETDRQTWQKSINIYRVLPRVVASQSLRMSHYCTFGVAFPTFYSIVSGDQNSSSGGKRRLSGG